MTPEQLKNLRKVYRDVFESDNGKIILKDLKNRCHINSSTYSEKTNETFFLEGQRRVALYILDMLREDNRELPTTTEE